MPEKNLRLYLDLPTLERVKAKAYPFFNRMTGLLENAGWSVDIHDDEGADTDALHWPHYALFHMRQPVGANALTCRRTYVGSFWHIETTHERWNWPVAHNAFEAEGIPAKPALTFFEVWRDRILKGVTSRDEGFVFVPLQGRLTEHRSFQSMSPFRMIETILEKTAKPIVATLHPKEPLSPLEKAELTRLVERFPRLTVTRGGSDIALRDCSYVVSQNSSMVFKGYFLKKPAVLFAGADFHHIAGSVPRDGVDNAFESLSTMPDFERYLFWFLKKNCLNAGLPEFDETLPAALRSFGWPI